MTQSFRHPSLQAQGRQRRSIYFINTRDIPGAVQIGWLCASSQAAAKKDVSKCLKTIASEAAGSTLSVEVKTLSDLLKSPFRIG